MRIRVGAALLLGLGLLQMAASLAGNGALAAVAAATGASPAPKVFSSVGGLETHSSRFAIEWMTADGREHAVTIGPDHPARLAGPYNRRNVYGAALAYGPVLSVNPHTRAMWEAVARHALCGDAPLLDELSIPTPDRVGPPRIRVAPRRPLPGFPDPVVLEAPCQ